MQRIIGNLSIGVKLWAGFGIVLILLLVQGLGALRGLSQVQEQVDGMVQAHQPAVIQSLLLSSKLQEVTGALGFYLLSKEQVHKQAYQKGLVDLQSQLGGLESQSAVAGDPAARTLMTRIRQEVGQFKAYETRMLELAASDNANILAMQFASARVNPVNRELSQLINMMIQAEEDEEASEERKALSAAFNDLRYRWAVLNNEIRLFLAFRNPAAKENIGLYREMIVKRTADLVAAEDELNMEQADAVAQLEEALPAFFTAVDRLVEIHGSEKWRTDAYLIRSEISPLLNSLSHRIQELVAHERQVIAGAADATRVISDGVLWQLAVLAAIALVLVSAIAWLLARGISRPLKQAVGVAGKIAGGELDNRIQITAGDETGELLRSLDDMQRDLRERLETERRVAAENARIKYALDKVQAKVTVSDRDNRLIYMNDAGTAFFDELMETSKAGRGHASAQALIGSQLADFFPDDQLAGLYRQQLNEPKVSELTAWERILKLITSPIFDNEGEYQGRITQWIDITHEVKAREQERTRLEEERLVAAANLRLKVALDNVSSNVMVTDENYNVIYMNNTSQALFSEAEADIRQDIPAFDAARIVGSNIDIFHQTPSYQRAVLDKLTEPHRSGFEVGGRMMRFVANPVIDAEGERLGTVVEWTDRTAEVAVEREIDEIVEAARSGDLSRRIDMDGKDGFFEELGTGINALIDEMDQVFGEIAKVMGFLAQGDLSRLMSGEYQGAFGAVKSDINESLSHLEGVVRQLRESADVIATTSDEITSGNTNLSARTEQQASSLEETSSSMEELTGTVRNNADNAQQANQLASNARQKAEQGGEVVSRAVQAMEAINTASSKIAEIIGVIDEIAFQTNLLALNASVEAARAGEQGRGFAVVATEVRNLAGRSAKAAKEIKELIQDSVAKVESGAALVNESGTTLEEIVGAVKKVGDIIAEIASASAEQSAGIDQVNHAVTSMDQVTQQNAALASQTSGASASLNEKAREMEQLIGFFTVSGVPVLAAAKPAPVLAAMPRHRPAVPRPVRPAARAAVARPASPAVTKPVPAAANIGAENDEWDEF